MSRPKTKTFKTNFDVKFILVTNSIRTGANISRLATLIKKEWSNYLKRSYIG